MSYLQYVYILDLLYQKGGTVSYLQYVYVLDFCIRKRETVSYLPNVYVVNFEYQKEENRIILTISLLSRLCVSERRKLYHFNNVRFIKTFWQRKIKGIVFQYEIVEIEEIVSYMKLVIGVVGSVCIKPTLNCKVSYSVI